MSTSPIIRTATDLSATLGDLDRLVMAWARDRDTGEPTYILDLGQERRGAQCRCDCASCEQPLVAVNAAKQDFRIRPHFRHPPGSESQDCMILSARLAVLKALQQQGEITLPQRRIGVTVEGITGQLHQGWVSAPVQTLRITDMHFQDRAAARIVLEDGSELRVVLTGTLTPNGEGAMIFIDVAHPEVLADMHPDELRKRLTLSPPDFSWCRHWRDVELEEEARALAIEEADKALDWVSEDDRRFAGLDPSIKRETILHLEVKKILAEAKHLSVPPLVLSPITATATGKRYLKRLLRPAQRLQVQDAMLEKRFGSVIPDVTCQVQPVAADGSQSPSDAGGPASPLTLGEATTLFIEVTVTHGIDVERQTRIERAGHATLEIDLRRTGGRVTREELRLLVLEDLELKRWIFHPELLQAKQTRALAIALDVETLARPFDEVADEYLKAVERCLPLRRLPRSQAEDTGILIYDDELKEAIHAMRVHGYPEAGDHQLWDSHCILDRLLSIQANRGIGYESNSTGFQVLNAIRQSRGKARSDWTIYLIAAKIWLRSKLNARQTRWLDEWSAEVRAATVPPESMQSSSGPPSWWPDSQLLRSPKYDRILATLFPELRKGLAFKWGKFDENAVDLHEPQSSIWLQGNALERWKRENPESALIWQKVLNKANPA